jgi:hypothetical protein
LRGNAWCRNGKQEEKEAAAGKKFAHNHSLRRTAERCGVYHLPAKTEIVNVSW